MLVFNDNIELCPKNNNDHKTVTKTEEYDIKQIISMTQYVVVRTSLNHVYIYFTAKK